APFIDLFADFVNHVADADVRQRLMDVAPAWSSQALLVSVQQTETAAAVPGPANSFARQFLAALAEASRKQPVVLFIDDFHWADTASVQLVAFLSLWLAQLRMLLIITSRSSELLKNEHPFAALSRELEVKGAFRQLRLDSLSVDELSDYVDLALPA